MPRMKIATWNFNSVRSRLERLLAWLARQQPDVLCLQELKCADEQFPQAEIERAGYHAAVHGQRTYNGVAILSRVPPDQTQRGFDDGAGDAQARHIAARFGGLRVASIYVPNGSEVGSEKYAYKLDWLRRLRAWLERCCDPGERLALCGDFNIAADEKDVAEPEAWSESVLFHPEMREALRQLTGWGLDETFRLHHPDGGHYSWWDYRRLAFPRNDGLKIDHILASAPLARSCTGAAIDRQERKGKKPSDHAPVIAEFS